MTVMMISYQTKLDEYDCNEDMYQTKPSSLVISNQTKQGGHFCHGFEPGEFIFTDFRISTELQNS